MALAPTGFPRLSGRYQGALFDLQVVPDTLTYRKLPALWLLVTLAEPTPARATLDVMLRPRGVEPFSNFRDLAVQITTPPGFPEDCAIRSDAPRQRRLPIWCWTHLARLDPDLLKEMVISPKGLRLVWLAEEADRTRYLAFRDAEMGKTPLAPALLEPLLAALLALRDDLKEIAMSQPLNPHLVLLAATILPGSGQVLNRQPIRGLTFVFFIILLGRVHPENGRPRGVTGRQTGGRIVRLGAGDDGCLQDRSYSIRGLAAWQASGKLIARFCGKTCVTRLGKSNPHQIKS